MFVCAVFATPQPGPCLTRTHPPPSLAALFRAGEGVLKQWSEEPTLIALTFVLFIAGSLVPMLRGAGEEKLGPFTAQAELLNGRAAMCVAAPANGPRLLQLTCERSGMLRRVARAWTRPRPPPLPHNPAN